MKIETFICDELQIYHMKFENKKNVFHQKIKNIKGGIYYAREKK